MGCGTSGLDAVKLNKKRETVFGVLEVRVQQALIEHETSVVFSMDPYVNVKFSNQKHSGTIIKKGGKNPKFNDVFKFIVNSCYKYYGRCLEVQLMDSNTGSDSLIGYGIIDLDPYLSALHVKSPEQSPGHVIPKEPQSISLRCFLNYDRKQAGFITLAATFREEKVEIINFRFQTADLKRSTRTFGDMNCSVRVTIGQQILETKKKRDTKLSQPVWKDEHLTFICPESVENVLIEIMDEDDVIGSLNMPKLDLILQKNRQQSFERQVFHKHEVAGRLRFNVLLNFNPIFKELEGQYKKKTTQQKVAQQKQSQIKKADQVKPVQIKIQQNQSHINRQEQKPEQNKEAEKKPENIESQLFKM